MKVFGVGMFKTGTTSLQHALTLLNFKHVPPIKYFDAFTNLPDIDYDFINHTFTSNELNAIKEITSMYNAFSDHPWIWCYKQCYNLYPDAKFILTTRSSSQKVANSEINFWKAHQRVDQIDPESRDYPDAKLFIERYESHNSEVREFFVDKPNNFLEVCWEHGHGWNELCEFLNLNVPKYVDFPHSNSIGELRSLIAKRESDLKNETI